jgi:hypothetical protein
VLTQRISAHEPSDATVVLEDRENIKVLSISNVPSIARRFEIRTDPDWLLGYEINGQPLHCEERQTWALGSSAT